MNKTTVSDIIRGAMRKIGVLAAGEPLPADEGDDALVVFRQMVDSWTIESLLIPVVSVITHELIDSTNEYTIGIYPEPVPDPIPLNHIETARPEKILAAYIRDQAGNDFWIKSTEVKTYSMISVKSTVSRPDRMYVRKGWPLNTILFDSIPYSNEYLRMEVIQPLSEYLPILGLTEEISLPPGYEKALIYNLALDLSDEWGKEVKPATAVNATESKKWIKRSNYRDIVLRVDNAISRNSGRPSRYDINSDKEY